jgi:hypothetical protein
VGSKFPAGWQKNMIYDSCYNARMEQGPTIMQELYKAVINAFSVSFCMACHNLIYFVVRAGVDKLIIILWAAHFISYRSIK